MGITSFYFLCFYAVSLILYYIIPKKIQWPFLLLLSFIYFLSSGEIWLIVYPFATITITYFGGCFLEQCQDTKKKKRILTCVVLSNLLILVILKYLNFGVYTYNAFASRIHQDSILLNTFHFLVPLGLSFYTLSILGYIFDVYYEIAPAEKNFAKLLHFGMYFPTIISGPIVRYHNVKDEYFKAHYFDYQQVTKGVQRIVWGFFKSLVISERLSIIVTAIYGDYHTYGGCYIVIATICFALQLYTNFSGSMDIVIGISQTFGIVLPENFNTPFFSKTMQEFWRRWHITLGAWLKDYLFYPILRTSFFMQLPMKLKKIMSKKAAKQITTFSCMFILWFAVGLWHGGAWKYIIGSGILHWCYIVIGELLEPLWVRMRKWFHITDKTKWFCVFQSFRTFILVCSGFLFFNSAGMMSAFRMYANIVTTWNPEIIWNGSLLQLGLDIYEWMILIVSLLVLFTVSAMQQKQSVREWLAGKNIIIRWTILYALLFYVILLGNYGPGYSAAEFIYQGF